MKKTDWNLTDVPLEILQREFKARRRIDILERQIIRDREAIAKRKERVEASNQEIGELKAGLHRA